MDGEYPFREPENFDWNCHSLARRVRFLTWAYQEVWHHRFEPGGNNDDLIELSIVLMDVIASDMRALAEGANEAGVVFRELQMGPLRARWARAKAETAAAGYREPGDDDEYIRVPILKAADILKRMEKDAAAQASAKAAAEHPVQPA